VSSFKPQVMVSNDTKWYDNALRFATQYEAEAAARDLAGRWTAVRKHRAAPSEDPVNSQWDGRRAVPLELAKHDNGK